MEQVSVIGIDLAKSVFQLEAEAVQALVRVRLLQIKRSCRPAINGAASSFGIVMPKGHQRLREAIARLGDDPCYRQLPPSLPAAIDGLRGQLGERRR